MRSAVCFLFVFGFFFIARADVTLVQSVQPVAAGGALEAAREMTLYLSGDKLRLDSGDISSIIRVDKKMTYSILHGEKMFMALAHGKGAPQQTGGACPEPIKVSPTGKSEQINGFSCVEVIVDQSDGTRLDAWLTRDAGAVKALGSLSTWQTGEYAPVLAGMGFGPRRTLPGMEGMPVRTTVLGPDRKPTVRVEIKHLNMSTIRPDLFEPPAGYREISMEEANSVATPQTSADLERQLKELDAPDKKHDAKP